MLSYTNILDALARLKLLEPAEKPLSTKLHGGISSEIYKFDLQLGSVCIKSALPTLKSDPEWHVPVERSAAEWEWLKLAEQIVPGMVPDPIGYDECANIVVMAYLEPDLHPNWKDLLRHGQIDPSFAAATADRLVDLHNATANVEKVAEKFGNDQIFHDIRLEAYFLAAGRTVPIVNSLMTELVEITANTKCALVHGDVSPKNILAGPDGPVFLDAECAWYGEPAFDAAFCLTHFLLKCLWQPQWKSHYLECHQSFRETYLSKANWLDQTELDRRVTQLHLGILLARVAGRSKVEYISDPALHNLVKIFTTENLLDNLQSTAEVAVLWKRKLDDH